MSHFAVMVIGDDPEEQLEKFNENNSYPIYCKGDVSEIDKQRMIDYYKENKNETFESFDECYKEHGAEWNDYLWKKSATGIWKEYSTDNPYSKWDWYELGGRWSGRFLILKEGATGICGQAADSDSKAGIDQAYKKDIDFEKISSNAYEKALALYQQFSEKCGGEIPRLELFWSQLFENEYAALEPDERKKIYNKQKAVKIWTEAGLNQPFGYQLEDFQCTAEEFADRAANSSFSTFAYLLDYEWYERGEMVWFGVSTPKMTDDEWDIQIRTMLEKLPDDAFISIYDCHI